MTPAVVRDGRWSCHVRLAPKSHAQRIVMSIIDRSVNTILDKEP